MKIWQWIVGALAFAIVFCFGTREHRRIMGQGVMRIWRAYDAFLDRLARRIADAVRSKAERKRRANAVPDYWAMGERAGQLEAERIYIEALGEEAGRREAKRAFRELRPGDDLTPRVRVTGAAVVGGPFAMLCIACVCGWPMPIHEIDAHIQRESIFFVCGRCGKRRPFRPIFPHEMRANGRGGKGDGQ